MPRPTPSSADAVVGRYFREQRKSRGKTLEWVAGAMIARAHKQWTAATVSGLETGRRNVTAQELVDLAASLGCALPDLTHCARQAQEQRADDYVQGQARKRTEQRFCAAVNGGRTPSTDELNALLSARQQLIDQGVSPTWATRRLIAQLAVGGQA